jgi:hypothetical protein
VEVIVDFQPRELGAYALMEIRMDTSIIQPADANGQQVSVADIEVDASRQEPQIVPQRLVRR